MIRRPNSVIDRFFVKLLFDFIASSEHRLAVFDVFPGLRSQGDRITENLILTPLEGRASHAVILWK